MTGALREMLAYAKIVPLGYRTRKCIGEEERLKEIQITLLIVYTSFPLSTPQVAFFIGAACFFLNRLNGMDSCSLR